MLIQSKCVHSRVAQLITNILNYLHRTELQQIHGTDIDTFISK